MAPTLDKFVRKEGVNLPSDLAGREVGLKPKVTALLGATRGIISRTKSGEGFDTHKLKLGDGVLKGVSFTVDNGESNIYTRILKGKEKE